LNLALDIDGVLADTQPLWREWLDDASRRFRAIAALDPAELPADRGSAAERLDRWAEAGIGDWRAALERFAEDRAPLFFRPEPTTNATVRRVRAAGGRLVGFTDAPEPLARIAVSQLGLARELEAIEAGRDAEQRALAHLGPGARVVRTRDELAAAAP